MKLFVGTLLLIVLNQVCTAQFYYKDLVAARESSAKWKLYRDTRVKSVQLVSTERDGSAAEGFQGDQEVTADGQVITTHTKAKGTLESWIITSYTPQGLPLKTTDTSQTY